MHLETSSTTRVVVALPLTLALLAMALAPASAAQNEPRLTETLLSQRIDALRASGEPPDEPTLAVYEAVQRWLEQAASHERDAETYVQALATAPQREAEAQQRLDQLEADQGDIGLVLVPSGTELQAELAATRLALTEESNRLSALERQLAARESVAELVRARLGELGDRLASVTEVSIVIRPELHPSLAEANEWLAAAEQSALAAEQKALNARLASQPARYAVMQIERAQASLTAERLASRVRRLESQLASAPAERPQAPLRIAPTSAVYDLAHSLHDDNASLFQQLGVIRTEINELRSRTTDVEAGTKTLGERFSSARRVVEYAAGSKALGSALVAYWWELGDYRSSAITIDLPGVIGDVVISRIRHEEALARIASAAGFINQTLTSLAIEPERVSEFDQQILGELVRAKRDALTDLIAAESDHIDALRSLQQADNSRAALIEDYETFLGGLIIWVPSHAPLWQTGPGALDQELRSLGTQMQNLRLTAPTASGYGIAAVALLALLARRRLRSYQTQLNTYVSRPSQDSIRFTMLALLAMLVRALPVPLLILALSALVAPSVLGAAVSSSGAALAGVLYVLLLLRTTCEPSGLGGTHFGWRQDSCRRVFELTGWLMRTWLPVAAIATVVLTAQLQDNQAAVGRLLFLLAIALLAARVVRSLLNRDPDAAVLTTGLRRSALALLGVLLLLTGELIVGHMYALNLIDNALVDTLIAGVALLLAHSVLTRGLRVARRRARLAELTAAREQRQEGDTAVTEEPQADLGELSAETSQLLNVGAIVAAAATLLYIWSPLLPALETLERITLWTTTSTVEGETTIVLVTLATLLQALALIAAVFFTASRLPALVELLLRSRTTFSAGSRYTISTLLSYVIVGAGTIMALATLGLKWSQLQWLIAALGVGIGFGLQEIVANFISGLIILFERPIRVGDIVTVGDQDGTVTRIRIRATTIRNWDGQELLVPNKEFITGRLLNWSLSDPLTRLVVPVGIAYGSDLSRALELVRAAVTAHPRVLTNPEPSTIIVHFGNDSLELAARCFIDSIDDRLIIGSEIREAIYERLNEAGIVIAFPQRDVHIDAAAPIRVVVDGTG